MTPAFALFLLFLGLKLAGIITWSYVWVTAPLWIGPALFVVLTLPVLALAAVFGRAAKGPRHIRLR